MIALNINYERKLHMVTYACLALMFLFVIIKSLIYYSRRKQIIAPVELDRKLLTLINHEEREL